MQLPSAVNLELLQLALNFLQVLTTGEVPPRLLATLTEAQLPLALCNMLMLEPPHPSMARWGGAQRADLQQAVMALGLGLGLGLGSGSGSGLGSGLGLG